METIIVFFFVMSEINAAEIKRVLDRIYNDPESPAAFGGKKQLLVEGRKVLGSKLRQEDVDHYLRNHRTYTLMRPRRVHFERTKTIAAGFMTDVQADMADMQKLEDTNDGYKYILVVIDVLSKQLFVHPCREKSAEETVRAFKEILKQMPIKPQRIFTDLGTEFKNRKLKAFCKKEDIEKYEATSPYVKATVAERAIRTLKQRIYRYFAQHQTENWVDVIQKIVDGINRSPSRVHGLRPIDVNSENAQEVWKRMYGDALSTKPRKIKTKLKEGDFVKMSRGKHIFEKGYYPNWGDEILEIDAVKKQSGPIRYKLRDDKGEEFKGSFYDEELQKVRKDAETEYRIEREYQRRRQPDGTYKILVKFMGYRDKEWIHESQLV